MTSSQLRLELIQESPAADRCPHLRVTDDDAVCFCSRAASGEEGVLMTDHASLQLWCLEPARHSFCILYPKAE